MSVVILIHPSKAPSGTGRDSPVLVGKSTHAQGGVLTFCAAVRELYVMREGDSAFALWASRYLWLKQRR